MNATEIWFYSCGFGTGVFSAGGDAVSALAMGVAAGVILSFGWLVVAPAINKRLDA